MATATKLTGESFGYKASGVLKILNGTKLITGTITPQDADLHDISKEGLLVTSISWRPVMLGVTIQMFLALFNRTSNVAPVANVSAAAWRDSIGQFTAGAAYISTFAQLERNTSILPGGGVPLIADFISISAETSANVGADTDVYYDIFYKWIPINPDDYRKVLYARSI